MILIVSDLTTRHPIKMKVTNQVTEPNRSRLFFQEKISLVFLVVATVWMINCNHSPFLSSRSGSEGVVPSKPRRIISLSPSVTEILEGIGAFEQVVAVSDYCSYPAGVEELPRLGGWQNASIEKIASLRPDLIIMSEIQAPFIDDQLQALRFKVLVVDSKSLSDIFSTIELIGQAVGREPEAEKLLIQVQSQLDSIALRTEGLSKPRVLCVVDRVPGTLRGLYVATKGSYLTQLIEVAGGLSIVPSATSVYAKISKEAIVTFNPEVIIDMVQGTEGSFKEDVSSIWNVFNHLHAVREGRLYAIREMFVIHPSQFVVKTAELFAKPIHPEEFTLDAN